VDERTFLKVSQIALAQAERIATHSDVTVFIVITAEGVGLARYQWLNREAHPPAAFGVDHERAAFAAIGEMVRLHREPNVQDSFDRNSLTDYRSSNGIHVAISGADERDLRTILQGVDIAMAYHLFTG
jgi:hypothetical protein